MGTGSAMGRHHYSKPRDTLESSFENRSGRLVERRLGARPLPPLAENASQAGKMKLLTGWALALGCLLPLGIGACATGDGEAQSALDYTDNARRDYEAAV